ncbi:leucine-rich_repeat domain-containing protein [Hexamita inflata]|uniref:Leucine-rich_repeat domain-containing protein n=1 Tax=Hexamita inflata TaxID=28002 RepID=A0ABP1GSM9_9EUKA
MNQENFVLENRTEDAEYNYTMKQKYKHKIQNGELQIKNIRKLINLKSFQDFQIHKLELIECTNIVAKLKNSSIKELIIRICGLKDYEDIELENLEILEISNWTLKIQNIQKFNKLQHLNITCTNCTDISNLYLPQLRILNLRDNKLKDLTPISKFVNLEELNLSNNQDIKNTYPIQYLKKLTKLNLSYCQLYFVIQFEELTNLLVELDVSDNFNVDLSSFKHFVNLKILNISRTNTDTINVLQPLNNLETLDISKNDIVNIDILKYFCNLTYLNLSYTDVQNIELLPQLVHLKEIDLSNNPKMDFQPLQKMIQLRKLILAYNQLSNISFLSGLINLKHLNLSSNNILEFTPLQYVVSLTYLNISSCKIIDISYLRTLVKLEVLHMRLNQISNISHLQNLVKLTDLDISYNFIKEISVLKKLKCLKTLWLSRNKGVNIAPLQYLVQLTELTLDECDLYEISALKPLENLEYLDIASNYIIYFYPISSLETQINFEGNLTVESSDLFTFYDVKNKSQYTDQPTEQQIQLAEKMKMVDVNMSSVRDINSKRKNYLFRKLVATTAVIQQSLKLYNMFSSFSMKVVQLFAQLDAQEDQQ